MTRARSTAGILGAGLLCVSAGVVLAQEPDREADDAAGERGRTELAALVGRAFEGVKAAKPVKLGERERAFGLPLQAFETTGLRVLSADGDESEAQRVAAAMVAARTAFAELTGKEAAFPPGLTAYLLGSTEAKTAFLTKHRELTPQVSERLSKLEGAGVPNSADWGWWEGDAEKRVDGMVRLALDWFLRAQGVTLERQAWLHEGLGFYLGHALVGTRLTWFVQPETKDNARIAMNVALRSRMDEPGADWMALAREVFDAKLTFDLEELLHLEVNELEPVDYLRAHALAGYLVEAHRPALGAVVTRVGQLEDPRAVLEAELGFPWGELRPRLERWLAERELRVARAAGERSEGELREQWSRLDAAQRRAAVAAFRRRVAALDTSQMRALRAVVTAEASEPPAAQEAPFFDPKVHAPAQPIARKRLGKNDARAKKLVEALRGGARRPARAYDFDWARAHAVRCGDPDDPESVFENALSGVPPGADRARAEVLALLARADEKKLQAAFAHAYTDRDGNVYPVTLFEMWAAGQTMEMPDVDVLGIVHDALDERRWTAPVPASQHGELYKRIGDLFTLARRSRELRVALADLFVLGGAEPQPGYETLALNLQALWASVEGDPAKLAALLPDGNGRDAFINELVARCKQDYKFYGLGRRRAAQLRLDGKALRVALGAALDEAQAAPAAPAEVPGGDH